VNTIENEVADLIEGARAETAELDRSMAANEEDAQRALVGCCYALTAIAIILARWRMYPLTEPDPGPGKVGPIADYAAPERTE
jgi:hypothetical protein